MFVQTGVFMLALLCMSHPEKGSWLYYIAFGIGYLLEMVPNYLCWGLGPIPNPQSPIPNPQSPIPNPHI